MLLKECKSYFNDERLPGLRVVCEHSYYANRIDSPAVIANLLRDLFSLGDAVDEQIFVLAAPVGLQAGYVFPIASGTSSTCLINETGIFRSLLLSGCPTFVVVHNHPGGSTTPSDKDIAVKEKLAQGASLLGLELLDFLIVTKDDHYSFRGNGR